MSVRSIFSSLAAGVPVTRARSECASMSSLWSRSVTATARTMTTAPQLGRSRQLDSGRQARRLFSSVSSDGNSASTTGGGVIDGVAETSANPRAATRVVPSSRLANEISNLARSVITASERKKYNPPTGEFGVSAGAPPPNFLRAPNGGTKGTMSSNQGLFSSTNNLTLSDYLTKASTAAVEPFHLHCYCHRHNTHITLTSPKREVLVSMSAGNVGFRKGRRKLYDAAFQLAAHVFKIVEHQAWMGKTSMLEVIYRDFGPGREAFTKVLLGTEGAALREKLVRVTDASRFKYGGTRSPKPRRLG